jgi:hypothetical protein
MSLKILMRLPVKSPEFVSAFIEASRNLKSIFLGNEDAKKTKNHRRIYRSIYLVFKTLKKLYISLHCPFKVFSIMCAASYFK